jgi:bifunctional DNA-binding transcriptional regulator/antitoxin component of YhaV-PrlF toxin-antitoxin module
MATATFPTIIEIARLRAKNQLTLPDSVARAIGAQPGDRLRIWVEDGGIITLVKVGASAYGKFPGLWGDTSEEIAAHLNELRDEWER